MCLYRDLCRVLVSYLILVLLSFCNSFRLFMHVFHLCHSCMTMFVRVPLGIICIVGLATVEVMGFIYV